jgi:predicted transcriptional regulator
MLTLSPVFSPAFLEELRANTTLSAVIGRTVKLQRAGREWKACCPFHEEQTPSFVVNDEKGFYHCFGCGAHGDAIRWLTDQRGLAYMDAVKELAGAAEMEIPTTETQPQSRGERATIITSDPTPAARKGGGKLNRSETVTVRLDPKLNYLCELAARAQRRTKSSFIEWAIADSLGSVTLPEVVEWESDEVRQVNLQEKASELWHVDEPDRVAALALIAPALLTHEEQLIWRLARENGYLWRGHFDKNGEWSWAVDQGHLILDRLREKWEIFKAVAAGEQSNEDLPLWNKIRPAPAPAFDSDLDDVPF